mgnify:CR=1 FL=1
MKHFFYPIAVIFFLSIFVVGSTFASDRMAEHDTAGKDRIGDLIHESVVDGYMLSYYFMDLRDQKTDHAEKESMDTPHHLMVYIMDETHQPILDGKVGFLIKGADGKTQKAMGMFMSEGFGITADMKKKGTYTISTKAVIGKKKLMDSFHYQIE